MPQDAGHAFCQCGMTAPMSLFYIFGRNINDYYYYYDRDNNSENVDENLYYNHDDDADDDDGDE